MEVDDITVEEKEAHVDIKTDKKVLTFTFRIDKEKKRLFLDRSPITSVHGKDLIVPSEIVREALEIAKVAILREDRFEDYEVIE